MAGPSWLTGTFAVVMILTAAYSTSRLAASRLRRQATEFDADALHGFMGVAMAGMLVPRLNVLPDSAWVAVFGIAAAWFGWHALRAARLGISGGSPCRFPVPHLIECLAMLYMLLAMHGPQAGSGGAPMGMAGMGSSGFPALPIVLALFMLGYIVWTTDRLTALARAKPGADGDRRPPVAVLAVTPAAVRPPPMLAPKLAACGKLAMGITMGYMLLLML